MNDNERHELAGIVKTAVDREMAPLLGRIEELERQIAALQARITAHEWRAAALMAAEMDAASPHSPTLTAN